MGLPTVVVWMSLNWEGGLWIVSQCMQVVDHLEQVRGRDLHGFTLLRE